MKLLKILTIMLLCIISKISYSTPRFISNLQIQNPIVCYGSNTQLQVSVANANFYQFQIQDNNGVWQNVETGSGNPELVSNSLILPINNLTWSANYRVFISNLTTNETVYSNVVFAGFRRPEISKQPESAVYCHGQNANFYLSATSSGVLQYQWQISTNQGASFSNLANNSNYGGVTTNNLRVIGLINSDHLDVFKCIIKDESNCSVETSHALLSVNQLGTTVSPTTSTTFCTGQTANFQLSGIVGEINRIKWYLRIQGSSSFVELIDTSKYSGLNSSTLQVKSILQNQNSYKADVFFKSLTYDATGNKIEGECIKSASRLNYTIHPRPNADFSLNDTSRCGTGIVELLAMPNGVNYNWYTDTTSSSISTNTGVFRSPILTSSVRYFVKKVDSRGCKSFSKAINALIHPKPVLNILTDYRACPSSDSILINFNVSQISFDKLSIINGPRPLSGFNSIYFTTVNPNSNYELSLPANKTSGLYNFKAFVQNSTTSCISDSLELNLKIDSIPKIVSNFEDVILCAGSSFSLSSMVEGPGPFRYTWRKNGVILSSQVNSILSFLTLNQSHSGNYDLIVFNECGSDTSNQISIEVTPLVQILSQPISRISICEGQDIVIPISATGGESIQYKWYKDNHQFMSNERVLNLTDISFQDNLSKFYCVITSDCGVTIVSDTVHLRVNKKPNSPDSDLELGYCQNQIASPLIGYSDMGNSLLWYSANLENLPTVNAPIPTTHTPGIQHFYVSQIDSLGCESNPLEINVIINSPVNISLHIQNQEVCSTGTLNIDSKIEASITGGDSTNIFYWYKAGILLPNENSAILNTQKGGVFELKVKNAYCINSENFSVLGVSDELNKPIYANDAKFCFNQNAILFADGEFSQGRFTWWQNENSEAYISENNPFTIQNVTTEQDYFVSYRKRFGSIFCESNRKNVKTILQEILNINEEIINETCVGAQNGQILIRIPNLKGSAFYRINLGEYQQNNVFSNLNSGSYLIEVVDSLSCISSKNVVVSIDPQPSFVSQPRSIQRCKGNTVTFSFSAQNFDQIKWQKKLPGGVFVDIPNSNTLNLRITSIGSANYPHLTKFRAIISKSTCLITSEEAELQVNSFSSTLQSQSLCNGQNVVFESPQKIGNPLNYQWQKRNGSSGSFLDIGLANSEILEINHVTEINNNTYFRCKVEFLNTDNTSCILTSDDARLTVISPSSLTLSNDTSICKSSELTILASNCNGTVRWSNSLVGSVITIRPLENVQYSARCELGSCISPFTDSINVLVLGQNLEIPFVSASSNTICGSDSILLSATNCPLNLLWNINLSEPNIMVHPIQSTLYSAVCRDENCSTVSSNEVFIQVPSELVGGQISTYSLVQCAGFNPSEIVEVLNSSGGFGNYIYKWQKSENCFESMPNWEDILNSNSENYNPSNLEQSTCFRRITIDSCGTMAYSNSCTFTIVSDPNVSIFSNNNLFCTNELVKIWSTVSGGVGICDKIWQINLVSSSSSSSNWQFYNRNSDTLILENLIEQYPYINRIYIRLKYDCELSNCNIAYSNVISIDISENPEVSLIISKNPICRGESVNLQALNCTGTIRWNNVPLENQILLSPQADTTVIASCQNRCGIAFDTIRIRVLENLELPQNNTPTSSSMRAISQFSAIGSNLLWFDSENQVEGSGSPPIINSPGTYTVFVAQSNGTCIGPRLRIFTTVYSVLNIQNQSYSFTNCKGNSAKMTVEAQGFGNIRYKWYRKKIGDMVYQELFDGVDGISNSRTHELGISNIGNIANPDSSLYRCQITDSLDIIFSEPSVLNVNYLDGRLPDFKACTGNDLLVNMGLHFKIKGSINKIQWQQKKASIWENLEDGGNINGSNSQILNFSRIQEDNSSTYRFGILFNNQTGTCIENSDQAEVLVQNYPDLPESFEIEHCQFDKSEKIVSKSNNGFINLWYLSNDGNESPLKSIPTPATDVSGELKYYLAYMNKANCISPRQEIKVKINPQPNIPINKTKDLYFDGDLITFAAVGTNLKWYSSKTTKTFSNQAPQFYKIGNPQYYVSQTNEFGCESERFLIKTNIVNKLAFTSTLENEIDCEGNSVVFSIKTKNYLPFEITWLKKRKNESSFAIIPNQKGKTLNIIDIGNLDFPDSTEIKCIIKDSLTIQESNIAYLLINDLVGNVPNYLICENGENFIDPNSLKIIGNEYKLSLQYKLGNTYTDLINDFNIENTILNDLKTGTYRFRVNFESNTKRICTKNSNDFKIISHNKVPPVKSYEFDICQSGKLADITFENSDMFINHWFDDIKNKELESLEGLVPGKHQLYLIREDKNSCKSDPSEQYINLLASPKLNLLDSLFDFCMFDSKYKMFFEDSLTFLNADDDVISLTSIPNKSPQIIDLKCFKVAANNCESKKKNIRISINPCYLSSTDNLVCEDLIPETYDNDKKVLITSKGKIVFEYEAKNDSMIKASLGSLNDDIWLKPYFKVKNYSNLPLTLKLPAEFFKNSNFQEKIFLNVYRAKKLDCELSNNTNFYEGETWQSPKGLDVNKGSILKSLEIDAFQDFELGLSYDSLFSLISLTSQYIDKVIVLNWEANHQSKPYKYIIQKSLDTEKWFEIDSILIGSRTIFNFKDKYPIQGNSFYRLVYQNTDGIKKYSQVLEMKIENSKPFCLVSPNPIKQSESIEFKSNTSKIKDLRLINTLGKSIPIDYSQIGLENHLIKPLQKLQKGLYFINAIDHYNISFACKLVY